VPFQDTIVSVARYHPFLARAMHFLEIGLILVVLGTVILVVSQRSTKLLGKWRYWVFVIVWIAAVSLLFAAVLTQFPPGHRLVPVTSAGFLLLGVVVWLKRLASKRHGVPVA
jgi:hypothetical protein